MTTLTDTQVITASGGLVELGYGSYSSGDITIYGTSQAAPTDLVSTTIVSDGSPLLVEVYAYTIYTDTGGSSAQIDLWVDGAVSTLMGRWTNNASSGVQTGRFPVMLQRRIQLSAGSHTLAARAWKSSNGWIVGGGAGTGGAGGPIFIRVSKIVQATQWPAVTTGTIICTSSTRPASPFVGQSIYETDTSLAYTYNGSAWMQTGNSTGAWTAFTPAWTNLTVGNGTTGARYVKVGRTVTYSGFITWGSTTSATSGYTTVSIPFTSANQAGYEWQGSVRIADAGTRGYPGECGIGSNATTMNFHHPEAGNFGAVNSTNPMTWTTNDSLYWTITYEAAS